MARERTQIVIYVVEDVPQARTALTELVKRQCPTAAVTTFGKGEDALRHADELVPDIAILDIELPGMNGLQLAERLKALNQQLNIIFTTGHPEYMAEAFRMHASGYLLKPVTEEQLREELNNLRYNPGQMGKRLVVRTFGVFTAKIDGTPLSFRYRKTEELLAYLINSGARMCTVGELINVLWEDGNPRRESYLRNLISDLRAVLRQHGCENVLLRSKGLIGVDVNRIDCDFYDWMKGQKQARASFAGQYMSQFSWAEWTLAWMLGSQSKTAY